MPWHPSFATHLPDIDAQHQYFVHLIDRLDIACQSENDTQIAVTLTELQRYARYHFASEELLMEAYEYPADTQRAEHRKLLSRLEEMIRDESTSRVKIQLFLYKWLTNHIQLEDFDLAKHVLERRKTFLEPAEAAVGNVEPKPRVTTVADD